MTVARILGAADIDRILVDRSLTSQGMDSLAALSLYNWLGQETSVYILLVDLLQGYSIETIATVIHNKLNERHQVASSSTTKEEHIYTDLIKENEIKLSYNSNYTEQLSTNIDNLNKLFIDKIYEQQNQAKSVLIYAIKIPSVTSTASTSTYARDMILQMHRIQPHGPYQ
ncbi:unnamed protein product [Adineta steineri]|nr:unnamed protein product [Adineta steineri]